MYVCVCIYKSLVNHGQKINWCGPKIGHPFLPTASIRASLYIAKLIENAHSISLCIARYMYRILL